MRRGTVCPEPRPPAGGSFRVVRVRTCIMRKAYLLSVLVLAWTGPVRAQDSEAWSPPGCAEVETGSLEAELLDCDAAPAPAMPPVVLEVLTPPEAVAAPESPEIVEEDARPEPVPQVVEAPEPVVVVEEEIEPPPPPEVVGQPEPVVVEVETAPESDAAIEDLPAEDWLDVHPIEETPEPVEAEVVEGLEAAEPEVREAKGNGRDRNGRALRIPNGHRPPPGSCRVWFPDRPPGHQPPPGPCDVEVPPGAVLVRG